MWFWIYTYLWSQTSYIDVSPPAMCFLPSYILAIGNVVPNHLDQEYVVHEIITGGGYSKSIQKETMFWWILVQALLRYDGGKPDTSQRFQECSTTFCVSDWTITSRRGWTWWISKRTMKSYGMITHLFVSMNAKRCVPVTATEAKSGVLSQTQYRPP